MMNSEDGLEAAAEKFVSWITRQVVLSARGDNDQRLRVKPRGRLWLGRLASEEAVQQLGLADRGERLSPCAIGIRFLPADSPPWSFTATVSLCAWVESGGEYQKSSKIVASIPIRAKDDLYVEQVFGTAELSRLIEDAVGIQGYRAEVRVEAGRTPNGLPDVTVELVNTTPESARDIDDTNLYECSLRIADIPYVPFELEALPDAFRYDRRVAAYGMNCGVIEESGGLVTSDVPISDDPRAVYWAAPSDPPDLRFATLADDPMPSLRGLVAAHRRWGDEAWSKESLNRRSKEERWPQPMLESALREADKFDVESARLENGIALLDGDAGLLRAFRLMNSSFVISAAPRYDKWRPFQIGFLLANLNSIVHADQESGTADIVWFATGGGKTETYLALLVTAALHERLTGRTSGVTAWSRFPLRMLSLQQTQRFANAMAGAEVVRRNESIPGDPFSVGFLVGEGATPNKIAKEPREGEPDPDDDEMPRRFQVLIYCPFCRRESLEMAFNRRLWKLEHRCTNDDCFWPEEALPFYIVDQEVFRFLPTVVVGTLDKAASIAVQGALRGLVAAPLAKCSVDGHGYVYSPRSGRPNGCLIPDCRGRTQPLPMAADHYGPRFRLQDELHLLRDSLGAVDAHYESLLDDLETTITGRTAKILASSATLKGSDRQIAVLYKRDSRIFPLPGPRAKSSFWSVPSTALARRFVALAPRGVTIEYALDRLTTDLQSVVRRLAAMPDETCQQIGIDPLHAADLLSLYGTDVVYGNTLRDLDAVMRSMETQLLVEGSVNTASLTGRTNFEDVRTTLSRLETPEPTFADRLHVVAASAMMSHGVDIDRLNVMTMLGIPLTTSEFIQATARVGRRWPGLVFVMHKIGRERDASVFRSFAAFVSQSDRFVEPIAITRRSRRVLERTLPGLMMARVLALHEPQAGRSLYRASQLRDYFTREGITFESERDALLACLALNDPLDEGLRDDLELWLSRFFRNLNDPSGTFQTRDDLCVGEKPMRSLRDVEEQAPVYGLTDA